MERILGGVFVSSVQPLNDEVDLLKEYNITHILSILPGPIPKIYTQNYNHKQIEINDDEYTDIIKYFPETNHFIRSLLFGNDTSLKKHKTNILIHCALGESRSVVICAAFLMNHYKLDMEKALYAIKRKKKIAPNEYFLEQLQLYEDLKMDDDHLLDNVSYKQFHLANQLKLDPSGASLMQEENFYKKKEDSSNKSVELRCKRCHANLAYSTSFIEHEIPDEESKQSQFIRRAPNSRRIISVQEASKTCSHFFLEPIIWMKDELTKGELEGRFTCSKCDSKVGGYCWQGTRCSCGKWMIPALFLQNGKVDCFDKNKDILAGVRVKAGNVV